LIASLQAAGPEGARRMRQLANATDAEIKRANEVWKQGQTEIQRYTNAVGGVPPVSVKGVPGAILQLRRLKAAVEAIPKRWQTDYYVNQINSINRPKAPSLERATGGPVFGPGSETSDSIIAALSHNEHVLSAQEVRGLGGHSEVERLRWMARSGMVPRFAEGGRADMRGGSAPSPMWSGIDMEQLVALVAQHTRPMIGTLIETPHNYGDFKRERRGDMARAQSDGSRFEHS
jgi:hypothetical protein